MSTEHLIIPDAVIACAVILTLPPKLCADVLGKSFERARLDRALDAAMGWASGVHNGWTGERPPLTRDEVPRPAMIDAVRRELTRVVGVRDHARATTVNLLT